MEVSPVVVPLLSGLASRWLSLGLGVSCCRIRSLTVGDMALVIGSCLTITVDGGHRAIKYSRVTGVKKEIYAEGMHADPTITTTPSHRDRNTY